MLPYTLSNKSIGKLNRLWILFAGVILISFSVLGYFGSEIYQKAPPIPEKVILKSGKKIYSGQDIKDGQNVWQSIGGQEVGTIWGHGSYLAPDWTADYLHREAVYMINNLSMEAFGCLYEAADPEQQAVLKIRLQNDLRKSSYRPKEKTIIISQNRYKAIQYLEKYYTSLFMDDPAFTALRKSYAIPQNAIKDPDRMKKMSAFFFWASWATVTERPDAEISYTHNWPSEELVGNKVTKDLLIWSGVSIILLILCIGLLAFYHVKSGEGDEFSLPHYDPMSDEKPTASMRLVKNYLFVVCGLMLLQLFLGIVTAHYGVEGDAFYGIPIGQWLPYSVTRTWHTQLAIFWIATAWLATGLYIAPAVSGKDPKWQCFGVNFLFIALIIVVLGSMFGQWMGIMQKLDLVTNFWFGHQGYEYVDLGRFWQILLFVGLVLWLLLMIRPLIPILKKGKENRSLLILFLISCSAIAMFYAAGLMWGRQTNLAIAEYWRWWVVHLWVEGFFEVFATVVLAFLFVRLGLLKSKMAVAASLISTVIFLSGGIIGTFHHLYFTGTPTAIMALGACFSALEVVPLTLIGYEAYQQYKTSKAKEWIVDYKWPIYFMVSVAFWNFLGAGVFGFIINPPIALYFVQGLNTTPLHGHTALFGVYGMLGIGLMLFVLRSLYRDVNWNERILKTAFWSLNIGLLAMAVLSLLPIGIWQAVESIQHGMWSARSAEFLHQPAMIVLKWLRSIGDTIFAVGIVSTCLFVFRLLFLRK